MANGEAPVCSVSEMGLAICRSIIEAHGGRLWVTPNDGPGVTMRFTVPAGSGGE